MSRASLYEQALGASYASLPAAVQRFHRLTGHNVLQGWVTTHAPASALGRALAVLLGSPRKASDGPLRFELTSAPDTETWTRHFPTRTMTSRMRLVSDQVEEKLSAATLLFTLRADNSKLSMELTGMRFLGVPCPGWLMPKVTAEETGDGDRLNFHVTASLPFAGTVAAYQGHLHIPVKDGP